MTDQSDLPARTGIKIERPPAVEEQLSFVYVLLLSLSVLTVVFTIWLLALEWLAAPLPSFLRSLA
jgi:hypothetical protein